MSTNTLFFKSMKIANHICMNKLGFFLSNAPGIILPMVDPALLTLDMMTKPKPSFSNRETLTS